MFSCIDKQKMPDCTRIVLTEKKKRIVITFLQQQ